jgi:type I restriction enzyme S subunit
MNQKNHNLSRTGGSSDNIPDLRFPEFANEGEWEEKSFEELFEIGNGRDYKHLDKGEIPVYGSGGYMLSVNDYLYDGESVCIGRKGTIDKPMFLTGKFWTVDTLFYSHSFKNCLPKYILYVFQNIDWRKHNEAGGVPSLSKTNIYKIEVRIPKPQEQQKIASCLSSLDELLAAHNQKLESLKDHKKGLMQNLFPNCLNYDFRDEMITVIDKHPNDKTTNQINQKNQTNQSSDKVPKYRFPEFVNDGEWVEKKLGDKEVSFFANQKTSIKELKLDSYISTENMLSDFSGICLSSKLPLTGSFTKFIKGDILISNIRPYLKKVWKAEMEGGASNDVLVFRAGSEVLSEFLEFILKNETFINYVMESAKGVKMPRGDKNSMQKYTVFIPTKTEQQKIAQCLSTLDDLITAQAEKIEQLKLHKKGLMQGLFPKIV